MLPDLTTDARELHFQPGAVFNKGLAATAVPATNPVPTAELKKWYISAIDDGDLKVFELDVRYSGGELFVKLCARSTSWGCFCSQTPTTRWDQRSSRWTRST